MKNKGTCETCGKAFEYALLHNGFNDSAYAYCDQCGKLTILDGWKVPKGIDLKIHQMITADIEPYLSRCSCGGRFMVGATPRCPHCKKALSAETATKWIEANAPGTAKGWRWQRSWSGLYAISIDGSYVKDNWKMTTQPFHAT